MSERAALSRRTLLVGAGAAGIGVAGAALGSRVSAGRSAAAEDGTIVPFYGPHQAGITTAAQDHLYFAAFDVVTAQRSELRRVLDEWTAASAQMTRGLEAGATGALGGPYVAPPDDTGEALGLPASSLTITVGLGASLFHDAAGVDRFGFAGGRPSRLIDLPHFAGDRLDRSRSDGDLCVQACANDPQVAFHAVRNLARIGFGVVALRWTQLGFGRTSSTTTAQATPRNLFGFKDGTANLKAEEHAELERHLWVQPGDEAAAAAWMTGGTYLVARRISMHIETWDRTSLQEQEQIVGRTKGSGAPLSGGDEFTEPDFSRAGRSEQPLIAANAHLRLAHPSANGGARILRRGYNFTDGSTGIGRLDAGLFFVAFVRDPAAQFVPMQTRLAVEDPMMEYVVHTGSALFAVPPGIPGEGVGFAAGLFT